MARRPGWWYQLRASKHEALLALDLYNRSTGERRLQAFVVHMQIAWLYLLHARFERDGVDYWYRDRAGRRQRVDGAEFKRWDLARSIRNDYDEWSPVRLNVEFFIGLRNRIEHRYAELLEHLVVGKCQALVLNYEDVLEGYFGTSEGLRDVLRFPLFVGHLTDGAIQAIKDSYTRLPRRLTSYIRDFESGLPEESASDYRYDFRVTLIPQTGAKSEADAAITFVRPEGLTDDQRAQLRDIQAIIRNRLVPTANLGWMRPKDVCRVINEETGLNWSPSSDHARAWRRHRVRPPPGYSTPEETDPRYCAYDTAHADYVYSRAWVEKLVREIREARAVDVDGR